MNSRALVMMKGLQWRASTDDPGERKVDGVTTVYFCRRERWIPVHTCQGKETSSM